MKPTPGPWTVPHFAEPEVTTCDCRSVLSESQIGTGAIATVHYQGEPGDARRENEPLETAKANAHLIAAAPDLVEALEGLTKVQDALYADNRVRPTTEWMAAMARSKAAIAKARGQE